MKKKLSTAAVGTAMALIFFLNISECTVLFKSALVMCAYSLVPSLLPFMIASDMIMSALAGVNIKYRILIITVCGLIFGFPICATAASKMYANGEIGFNLYKRMVCCGGIPSLGFTVGVCGSYFGYTSGITLYLTTLISALISFFLLGGKHGEKASVQAENEKKEITFFEALSGAIKGAVSRMTAVCGYVCFFFVLSGLICRYFENPYITAVVSGILEFSSGCVRAFSLGGNAAYVLCAAILSFSGLSVFMQCICIEHDNGAEIIQCEYILLRLFQTVASVVIAIFTCYGHFAVAVLLAMLLTVPILTHSFLQRINRNRLKESPKKCIMNYQK